MADACLVTGGTGMVGPAIVQRLLAEGWHVRVLTRQLGTPIIGAEHCRGDITNQTALRSAMWDVSVVHHLAGRAHGQLPDSRKTAEAYDLVNIQGTAAVIEAALATRVGRLVHYSTIAVYGPTRGGKPFDEQSDLAPEGPYAVSKVEAERLVRQATALRPTILRLAAVYGPRLKGNYARLVEAIRRGRYVQIGRAANRRTLIFDEDVAQAALLSAVSERAENAVFNVTDGEVHTLVDIVSAISQTLGTKLPAHALPLRPVQLMAYAADVAHALRLPVPQGGELLAKYLEDVAVRGDLIQRELGYKPAFGLQSGWQRALTHVTTQGRRLGSS